MKRQSSPAIVLRRWPYSENSLVVRALTPTVGCVPLLAKGVHRMTSGQLGVLDTWSLVELDFGGSDGAELLQIYRCRLLDRMSGLSEDPERLAVAAILAELAELGAPPGQASGSLFLWLQQALEGLASGQRSRSWLVAQLLNILEQMGLAPKVGAGEELDPEDHYWFSPAHGGLHGAATQARPDASARRTDGATLALLQQLAKQQELHAKVNCGQIELCLTILGDFLHYHLERPPRAWPLLHRRAAQPSS